MLYPQLCTIKLVRTHNNDILSILNRRTCSPLKLSFSEPTHWSCSESKELDNLNPWLLYKWICDRVMDECIYHHHWNWYVCLFIYIYVCVCSYVSIHTHTHIHTQTFIYVHTSYIYVPMFICSPSHTHTHTHTHTHRILLICPLRAYNN